jgi:hypothetical protein
MRRVILTFTVALAALATVGTGGADAYHLGGRKWPTRTITYHSSANQYKGAIRQAVRLWNTSGVHVRFKAVKASRAKLKIVYGGEGGPSGRATLGWTPVRTVRTLGGAQLGGNVLPPCGAKLGNFRVKCRKEGPMVWLDRVAKAQLAQPFYQHYMLLTVVHELGHSLGLKHNHPVCSVMSYRRDKTCPQPPEPWRYRCRLIERDDLKGVLKRYGGKAKPLAPEFCDAYPPPPPPTALSATYDYDIAAITAQWVNGASANVSHVYASLNKDTCSTQGDMTFDLGPATPGAPQSQQFYPDSGGHYCLTLWSVDGLEEVGPPVSTWVDVQSD